MQFESIDHEAQIEKPVMDELDFDAGDGPSQSSHQQSSVLSEVTTSQSTNEGTSQSTSQSTHPSSSSPSTPPRKARTRALRKLQQAQAKPTALFSDQSSVSSRASSRSRRRRLPEDWQGERLPTIPERKPPKPSRPTNVSVKGWDVYAAQDAGEAQMWHDDCAFYCGHLQSESAVQLAQLVSDSRTRQSLWKTSLSSILEAIGKIRELMDAVPTAVAGDEDSVVSVAGVATGNAMIVEALTVVLHFLSTDCTLASRGGASAARELRLAVLKNADALNGILALVVADPWVAEWNGRVPSACVISQTSSVATTPPRKSSSVQSTPVSESSSVSVNPAAKGRMQRKRRRLEASEDGLSFASSPLASPASAESTKMSAARSRLALDRLVGSVIEQTNKSKPSGLIDRTSMDSILFKLPLLIFQRLVSGKMEGDDESCLDSEDSTDEESNPLIVTNRLLQESGVVVPQLAQAMSDAAMAGVKLMGRDEISEKCLSYLQDRLSKLSTLVDGACLFHDENRKAFCSEGQSHEARGGLLVTLVYLLRHLDEQSFQEGGWGDVTIEVLRTLTSLTHDNPVAAQELLLIDDKSVSGISVIWTILHFASSVQGSPHRSSKTSFDAMIFCLNTLTNAVESGDKRVYEAVVDSQISAKPAPVWLTHWLVHEASGFRDTLLELGSSPSKHASRKLERQEDDRLLLTGNGFVLIACLLTSTEYSPVLDALLEEIPGDSRAMRLGFIIAALKAFANFYQFFIGELSVAVVAPVKKLILLLESLQMEASM